MGAANTLLIVTYSPGAIANYFLDKAWKEGVGITPMQLQKLIYFAQGWCLALNSKPLINEPLGAWGFGPVCSSIYHEFKTYGGNFIPKDNGMKEIVFIENKRGALKAEIRINKINPDNIEVAELLNKVWNNYSVLNASELSSMIHIDDEENPWKKTRDLAEEQGIARGKEIPNDDIKKYFKKLLKENRAY